MKLTKKDSKKFAKTKEVIIEWEGEKIDFHIKPLPINFQDKIEEILPFPDKKKIFDKQTKSWKYIEDMEIQKEKEKILQKRIYLTVILGIDHTKDEIEGETELEKLETLKNSGIPIGIFIQLTKEIQEFSGLSEDMFR